jgi:hypothetical protein
MDVSTDFDRGLEFKQNWLVDENVSGLNAEASNFLFRQLNLFAWAASMNG